LSERQVALVTGGGRGIGLGVCKALAAEGFHVAFSGRKPAEAVADSIAAIDRAGPDDARVAYVRSDVADPDGRERLVDEVERSFGALHVLVNNAGVAPDVRADMLDATEASFDRLIEINLKGPYFLTQRVAGWMKRQHDADAAYRGCVVYVGSISATVASTNRGDYCISKAGVAMSARLWAARLAEFNCEAYEVRPGVTATDMTAGVQDKYDRLIAEGLTVQPRWGTPEDVGSAVAVLAGGRLPYATGQVIHVDGGLTLQRL
jgi:NAD(P)-dependent dehydrogenase (short-subunit alcohol dehydrogenase family)